MQGSGKTTFQIRAMLNIPCACRFIFDDLGQYSSRLQPCLGSAAVLASSDAELEASVQRRWVFFNPHPRFPGQLEKAFDHFCTWVFKTSQRGPGKKIVDVDEVWRFQTNHQIPRPLATLAQMGRAEDIHLIVGTQLPHKINASITGQSTELVSFRLDEDLALDEVEGLGLERGAVQNLALGTFIARNRITRTNLSGKVF